MFNPNTCDVCYKTMDTFSVGQCDHPVCYECSTRMRVLCKQEECPICRSDLPKVVFIRQIKPFRHLKKYHLCDPKYTIYFEDEEIQKKFTDLLRHTCQVCPNTREFNTFDELKHHMARQHELYFCDLCVENLKIFSNERSYYNRSELAQHRIKGDKDDKSHKGHPLCEFCDVRYMDSSELYRHLRREHFYCYFCDTDGYHHYYCAYQDLRQHFRKKHFLCEEDNCINEQFTNVFRTEIDLQIHKASEHSRNLGKAAAKQARTLDLEFTVNSAHGPYRGEPRVLLDGNRNQPIYDIQRFPSEELRPSRLCFKKPANLDLQSNEQFPTLGNVAPVIPSVNPNKTRGNLTIRSRLGQPMITEEDFPALEPSASGTVNVSVTQPNVSIHFHKSNGTVTTSVNNIRIRSRPDFPALSASSSTATPNVSQWTKITTRVKPKPEIETATELQAAAPPAIQSGADFPSLKPRSKSSSISIVPSTSSDKGKTKKKKASVKKPEVTVNSSVTKTNGRKNEVNYNSNNVERKRSELKINNLSRQDFPLSGAPSPKPPPGFGSAVPPPGFATKSNDNRLTFTSSSGESYSIMPSGRTYAAPADFEKRNKNLVASVNEALGDEQSIKEFRYLSGLFRQGVCDAQEFYIRCRTSMGLTAFERIFLELMLLLPDIEKQRELFDVHKKEIGSRIRSVDDCAVCGQIVRSAELKAHVSSHDLEDQFPALGIATRSNRVRK